MQSKSISRKLLYAIISSAEYLQRTAYSEKEIFSGFKKQLDKFGLTGGISLLDETYSRLIIPLEMFTSVVMPSIRDAAAGPMHELSLQWQDFPVFRECIARKKSGFVPGTNTFIAMAYPESLRGPAEKALREIPDQPGFLSPLIIEGRVIGVLMLGSRAATESDLPIITSFANQVSTAIQNARLFSKIILAEAKYRDLVENVNEVIYTMDADGRFTYVSPRARAVLGYEPFEVLGRPFSDFVVPEDLPGLAARYAPILKGDISPSEYRVRNKAGEKRWVRSSSRPILVNGESIGVHGVLIDITDRKNAEEAYKKSEQEKTLILENVLEMIIFHDPEGRVLWANKAAETLPNGAIRQIVGHFCYEAFERRDTPCDGCPVFKALKTGQPEEGEVRAKNGTSWHVRGYPVRDEAGKVVGIVELTQDISARKETQKQLKQYADELEKKNLELTVRNKELDEFTYIASHDLQEPLNKIAAFCGLLRKDAGEGLPEAALKDFEFIQNAVKRMRALIQDLLLLSRTGKAAMKEEMVNLNLLTDKVLETFAQQLSQAGAQVTKDLLPLVTGDAMLLTQLYQNLVGNALKFTSAAPPRLHFSAERKDNEWILGLLDNGIGIAPEFFHKIFMPFQRLHARGESAGSGIGLSICKKVAERHGGTIWVESNPGQGAHFKFTLRA